MFESLNCLFKDDLYNLNVSCNKLVCEECDVLFDLEDAETNQMLYSVTKPSNDVNFNYPFDEKICGFYDVFGTIKNNGSSGDKLFLHEFQSNFFFKICKKFFQK